MVFASPPGRSDNLSLGEDAVLSAASSLRRDGFAVVPNMFGRDEVREVERLLDWALVRAARSPAAQPFLVRYPREGGGHHEEGSGRALDGWDQLELNYAATLVPALLETAVFRGCTALARRLAGPVSRSFDHVIYKGARNRTATPWHQDAAFALWRGSRPRQLHFWIPLQDVTLESGCMTFLAGSHLGPLVRHRRVLRPSGRPGQEAKPSIAGSISCPLALGGITLHTPTTLHRAGCNASTMPRKAWIIQYGPLGGIRLAAKRLAGALPHPLAPEGPNFEREADDARSR
ncbi:phytanoyl-CoA dioxygenase family protein [Sphingomonas desiccabilis]|nr:phytanoyl-CoA dioxygenase family protein [Sphingomonas desiccabilis]